MRNSVPKKFRKDYWKPLHPRKKAKCGKMTKIQSANLELKYYAEKRTARKWNWDAK